MMRKILLITALVLTMVIAPSIISSSTASAKGNGPNYGGNESIQTSIFTTHEELGEYLRKQEAKQKDMELEVFGQTEKGRDLYLVKYIKNPENPTVLYLTQQHGNEALNTEAALDFVDRKSTRLNSSHVAISYAVFCLK